MKFRVIVQSNEHKQYEFEVEAGTRADARGKALEVYKTTPKVQPIHETGSVGVSSVREVKDGPVVKTGGTD